MKVRILPEAEADLIEAADWYEARQSGLGMRLVAAYAATLARVAAHPQAWPAVHGSFRGAKIPRFPYRVVFGLWGDEVIVHAVWHYSLDPARLKQRLRS